jgi:hypothetical protein
MAQVSAWLLSDLINQPPFFNHSSSSLTPIWGFDMLMIGTFSLGLSLEHLHYTEGILVFSEPWKKGNPEVENMVGT